MKKVVWENKSNKQLCITIPKNSGVKNGDIVSIEKVKIKKIVYSSVVGEPFHYGHLQFLEKANELGDFHICGVLSDKVLKDYRPGVKANLTERKAIITALRCVDMVVIQDSLDPKDNLKTINEQFPESEIVLVHGDNWKKIIGEEEIKRIGGEVVKFPYYKRLPEETKNGKLK
jgi:cytidyltransferase-like protein